MGYKIRILYYTDDPECCCDYYGVEILLDDKVIQTYGDCYDDRGMDKVEGFFDCVNWVNERAVPYETERLPCIDRNTFERGPRDV